MTAWLGLILESTAIATAAAVLASFLLPPLLRRLNRKDLPPARRAELALVAGVTPILVGMAVLFALGLPSLLHVLGLQADHCAAHDHHRHLCALHASSPHLGLAAAGVGALLLFVFRAVPLAVRQGTASRAVVRLERHGRPGDPGEFPQVRLPGSPWISLAIGVLRPRVLISASLRERLDTSAFEAVIAHEEAHLRRRDPLSLLLLSWAGLFAARGPASELRLAFQEAAEEASDAEAASRLGADVVAAALVAVARVQQTRPPAMSMGFGYTSVERRVRVLISEDANAVRSLAPVVLLLALCAAAILGTAGSNWIHHAVESLIQ